MFSSSSWRNASVHLWLPTSVVALTVIASTLLAIEPPRATALDQDENTFTHRPSLWAPSFIQAKMGYEDWGMVRYNFTWNLNHSPDPAWSDLDRE